MKSNAFDALFSAGLVVQFTLLVLISLSVACWAVAWSKHKQFKSLDTANPPFVAKFWKATSLDSIFESVDQFPESSMARLFKAGYLELQRLADSPMLKKEPSESHSPKLSGLDNLERALRKEYDLEVAALESRLTVLATTGSTGPFIGLFGTVWGIMSSFQKIGETGSASLAVVAPGISEALIATAIGLAAAIPAVVLYNHFNSKIRREETALSNFSTDFLNVAKRNFFKGE